MKLITLTKGKVAMVSEEDFDFLSQWKWQASLESRGTKWYAIRWSKKSEHGEGKRYKIRMHRVIMEQSPHKCVMEIDTETRGLNEQDPSIDIQVTSSVVDHKNGDSLDNRRENLEVVSQTENMERAAGWKGSRTWASINDEEISL